MTLAFFKDINMLDYNELFYLKEYVPMANNYVFNDILPVAPLKLAALESCKDLATKVNDHIVTFRRNITENKSSLFLI